MLLLGGPSTIIENIPIFPDHADPTLSWYFPPSIVLAHQDGQANFHIIKYRRSLAEENTEPGGGYLAFQVALPPDAGLEEKFASRAAPTRQTPALAVVQFDTGTAQCTAFSPTGTPSTSASSPTPDFASRVLAHPVTSLRDSNTVGFGFRFHPNEITLVEEALRQGNSPFEIRYNLGFTAMRPSLGTKITADLKQLYGELRTRMSGQKSFAETDLDASLGQLTESGVITIEVANVAGQAELEEKKKQTFSFFKLQELASWFHPSLFTASTAEALTLLPQRAEALGTVTLDYSDAEPIECIYAPQASLSSLLAGLDVSHYETLIDLGDTYLRAYDIRFKAVFQWDHYVMVKIETKYTDEIGEQQSPDTLILDNTQQEEVWKIRVHGKFHYQYKVTYYTSRGRTIEIPWVETQKIAVLIDDRFPMRSFRIVAHFDWSKVEQVHITLSYTDEEHHIDEKQSYAFTATSEGEQIFQPTSLSQDQSVVYEGTIFFKDGHRVQLPPQRTAEDVIFLQVPGDGV